MKFLQHELGTKIIDGKPYKVVKNYFLYDDEKDWFKETHKEFSYEEKKKAKLEHKRFLKMNNIFNRV